MFPSVHYDWRYGDVDVTEAEQLLHGKRRPKTRTSLPDDDNERVVTVMHHFVKNGKETLAWNET